MSMTHQWHSPHWIRLPAGCQHYQHHAALAGARASIVRDLPVQQGVQAFPLYDRSVSQAVQGYLPGAAQPLADNPAKWPTQPRQTEKQKQTASETFRLTERVKPTCTPGEMPQFCTIHEMHSAWLAIAARWAGVWLIRLFWTSIPTP